MNGSGDATDQVLRIVLLGAEYSVRIAGALAKELIAYISAKFAKVPGETMEPILTEGK